MRPFAYDASLPLDREGDVKGYEEEEKLGGGSLLITYDPVQGFYLENDFKAVVAEAFTFMDGKEVQIQQYRLSRP